MDESLWSKIEIPVLVQQVLVLALPRKNKIKNQNSQKNKEMKKEMTTGM